MRLTIEATPPFDFELSANIFSDGDAEVRRYEGGKYWQVVRANGRLVLVMVASSGSVENPELLVALASDQTFSHDDRKTVEKLIRSIFNLDINLSQFYRDVGHDQIMVRLTRNLRGLRSPTTPTVFEALTSSIIEQQISLNVAHSIERNVVKAFGDRMRMDGKIYYAFPTPEKLAFSTLDQLRTCGLSHRKAEYIRDTSKLITVGELDLDELVNIEDTREILDQLCRIRGIGKWTAELTMVRGLRKFEVMPADDLGLRRSISHYYCKGRKISGEKARRIAEKWGRWKGLAGYYLMVAERVGVRP